MLVPRLLIFEVIRIFANIKIMFLPMTTHIANLHMKLFEEKVTAGGTG